MMAYLRSLPVPVVLCTVYFAVIYVFIMLLGRHGRRRKYFCQDCGEPIACGLLRCAACDWVIDFQCFDRAGRWLRSLEPEIAAIRNEMRRNRC
jgi:hypothetical protein